MPTTPSTQHGSRPTCRHEAQGVERHAERGGGGGRGGGLRGVRWLRTPRREENAGTRGTRKTRGHQGCKSVRYAWVLDCW